MENLSVEELQRLLEKDHLTQNDRLRLDTNVDTSLVEYCSDLRANEIEKVRILEENNLHRYVNSCCIILGMYGEGSLFKALHTSPISDLLQVMKEEYSGEELIKNTVFILPKVLLALGSNQYVKPKFEGDMPQKFMSFRNQTAQEWYEKFVNRKLVILSTIYVRLSADDAKSHLLHNLAYQLHHNNPYKYPFRTDIQHEDAVMEILYKFLDENGGDTSIIYSDNGEILSKSL